MSSRVIKEGNVTTEILDLTNGIGGKSAEEILSLTNGGSVREYTETRPDGSTVTYTIDVEEEYIEMSLHRDDESLCVSINSASSFGPGKCTFACSVRWMNLLQNRHTLA